jgi:hypothetical protein
MSFQAIPISFSISGRSPSLARQETESHQVIADKRYSRLPDVGTVGEALPIRRCGDGPAWRLPGLPQPILRRLATTIKDIPRRKRAKFYEAGFEVILVPESSHLDKAPDRAGREDS